MAMQTLYDFASNLDEYKEKLISEFKIGFEADLSHRFEMYSKELRKQNDGTASVYQQINELNKMMDDCRANMQETELD